MDRIHKNLPGSAIVRSDETPGGEDWVRTDVDRSIRDRLAYIGGMLGATSEMVTNEGNKILYPILDDSQQKGGVMAQDGTVTGMDLQNLGNKEIDPVILHSNILVNSLALGTGYCVQYRCGDSE